jgi:hypothetical protein
MKTPDPKKEVRDWLVSSNGYWYKGDVAPNRWLVEFRGTWEQVRERHQAMMDILHRHADERIALGEKQTLELRTYWPEA